MQTVLKPAAILALASLSDGNAHRSAHVTRALLALGKYAPNVHDLLADLIRLDLVVAVTGSSYGLTGKAYVLTATGETAMILGTV